jgi:hypothetical protein
MIKGGYYLKARYIQNSRIATAPSAYREIWDWLIKTAIYDEMWVERRERIRKELPG